MKKIWAWFESLVEPFPQDFKKSPPPGFCKFILFYTKGLWKFFIIIAILTTLLAVGEALFFSFMGLLVDWTTNTKADEFFKLHSLDLILMLVLSLVILPIATIFHSLLLHQTISSNYPMQIRWRVHRYLLGQSISFFTNEYAGRVANKLMQTAQSVRISVLKLIDVSVHMSAYIVTMLIMLAGADVFLSIPLIVWLIIYFSLLYIFIPKLRSKAQAQADSRSDMVGRIVDSYVNIATVKLFGGKNREEMYAKESMQNYINTEYKAFRILTLFDFSVQFLNYLLLIVLGALSVFLWTKNQVSAGDIAISIAIAIRMINMSRWMMWEIGAIFENIGTVYDGITTISKPHLIKDAKSPLKIERLKGDIEFKDVSFAYSNNHNIIKNLSFKIKSGQKIGIVGPSGAGKSTIINLLLRFYEVKSGQILVDNIDIRHIAQDELRDQFAIVMQEPSLMHRTIAENISYGCNDVTEEMLIKAAKVTDSFAFIQELSDYRGNRGFDAIVGERGAKLSGGQRQRIALARVVMKNSPILILDEATSALDSETEKVVQDNIEAIMQDRTVIAIAHRLSTLSMMDKILVIDQGQIVESGTHEQLIANNKVYKKLWDRQIGGFIGT